MTLDAMVAGRLLAVGLDPEDTEHVVRRALDEDLRYGSDVTSAAAARPGAPAVAGGIPAASRTARATGAPRSCGSGPRSGHCSAPSGPCSTS